MKSHGKTISVFLEDGSTFGLRHAAIHGWTGQALQCPRAELDKLKDWEEARRLGVYILLGSDDTDGSPVAYVGQAENVQVRIDQHLKKEFWNEAVLFTAKDDSLTKGHIAYLETRLYELTVRAKRYKLENTQVPRSPSLSRPERAYMEDFLDNIRLLLGALGHRVLEPILANGEATGPPKQKRVQDSSGAIDPPSEDGAHSETREFGHEMLFFRANGGDARALRTNEGFVILSGSTIASSVTVSLSDNLKNLRGQLIDRGVIEDVAGKLTFTRDELFNRPSPAACLVAGNSRNGRIEWKTSDGRTLAEVEEFGLER